jgi:hypothetical protein
MNTGPLAARALIAPRRHARADLHCLETVDYRASSLLHPSAGQAFLEK